MGKKKHSRKKLTSALSSIGSMFTILGRIMGSTFESAFESAAGAIINITDCDAIAITNRSNPKVSTKQQRSQRTLINAASPAQIIKSDKHIVRDILDIPPRILESIASIESDSLNPTPPAHCRLATLHLYNPNRPLKSVILDQMGRFERPLTAEDSITTGPVF